MDPLEFFEEKMEKVDDLERYIRRLHYALRRYIRDAQRALARGDRMKASLSYALAKRAEAQILILRAAEYQIMSEAIKPIVKDVKDILENAKRVYSELGINMDKTIMGIESMVEQTMNFTMNIEEELFKTAPPAKVSEIRKKVEEDLGEGIEYRGE